MYSDTKKSKKFLNEKNVKIAKPAYASHVEFLNSFNPELQLKDTVSAK